MHRRTARRLNMAGMYKPNKAGLLYVQNLLTLTCYNGLLPMPQQLPQHAIEIALQHHQAGRLAEAEAIYRHILRDRPDDPVALHLLGVVALQVGRHEAAVELIRRAIVIKSDEAPFYSNLGEALRLLGRLDEAADVLERAIALKSDYADAHNNLASVHKEQGDLERAAQGECRC